jgi:hypothetical protein
VGDGKGDEGSGRRSSEKRRVEQKRWGGPCYEQVSARE